MKRNHWPFFIFILFIGFPLECFADRGDRPEHEPHRPVCNQRLVNACIVEHRAGADAARAAAAALDPGLAVKVLFLQVLEAQRQAHERELSQLRAEISALLAETDDLKSTEEDKFLPPAPGFPPLEDFFHLHPLQKKWHERYAGERRQKLTARLQDARSEESDLTSRYGKITGEFQRLNSEFQSQLAARSNLLAGAGQHDGMWSHGCAEQICPPPEL